MGNYVQLKQAVSDVIKTNGNQEITGAILQNALLTIISTVGDGATFAGIATPETNPGTPDQNVFYIAAYNGVYPNFNGISLINEVCIISNKNGTWEKINTNIPSMSYIDIVKDEINQIIEKTETTLSFAGFAIDSNGYLTPVLDFNTYKFDVYGENKIYITINSPASSGYSSFSIEKLNGEIIGYFNNVVQNYELELSQDDKYLYVANKNTAGIQGISIKKENGEYILPLLNSLKNETEYAKKISLNIVSKEQGAIKNDGTIDKSILDFYVYSFDVSNIRGKRINLSAKGLGGSSWALFTIDDVVVNGINVSVANYQYTVPQDSNILRISNLNSIGINGIEIYCDGYLITPKCIDIEEIKNKSGEYTNFVKGLQKNVLKYEYSAIAKDGNLVFVSDYSCYVFDISNSIGDLFISVVDGGDSNYSTFSIKKKDGSINGYYAGSTLVKNYKYSLQSDDDLLYIANINTQGINAISIYNSFGNMLPIYDFQKTKLETYLLPPTIYCVCNDITEGDPAFRNYSVRVNIDHFFRKLNKEYQNIHVDKGRNYIPIYSPINYATNAINSYSSNSVNDKLQSVISAKIVGDNIEDINIDIPIISTRNKATENHPVRLLCIGDSVTQGFLTDYGKPYPNSPKQYWAWVKALFEMDKIENSENGFFFESLGNLIGSSYNGVSFDINFNGIVKNNIKAFAIGAGGNSIDNMFSPTFYSGQTNPLYNPESNTFSLKYWVENYRTLIVKSDGTTERCTIENKGQLAPSYTTQYNVCEPTHVLFLLGYNGSYSTDGSVRDNYISKYNQLLSIIKSEYPDIKVLLTLPDVAGTYFPQYYNEYCSDEKALYSMNMYNGTTADHHNRFSFMNKDLIEICSQHDNAYYVPTYFITPGPMAMAARQVSETSFLASNSVNNNLYVACGDAPIVHPNCVGHANFAYQIYSLIKSTLI